MKNKYPNEETLKAFLKSYERLQTKENIMVSISGGADSDIMLDLLLRMAKEYNIDTNKFHFVFFETGIEYNATRKHLDELEEKYHITIERARAKLPVPMGCKKYGIPFLSKFISQMIERLQHHNFDFKNDGWKDFEELKLKYPKMVGALTWWCNAYPVKEGKHKSLFNINNNKFLKEFMIENPPDFPISAKCCDGAKKDTSHNWEKCHNIDCKCVGLRKTEGGLRSAAVKSCWTDKCKYNYSVYRPIFWFTDKDKKEYKDFYGIKHSDCYEVYGMVKTGCALCPYGNWEEEWEVINKHEPKLANACQIIFGKAYEYDRKYQEYKKAHLKKNLKKKEKQNETSNTNN